MSIRGTIWYEVDTVVTLVTIKMSVLRQTHRMKGMAMKNLLGASPSLDFGVMSFLWQGSFSIGNHSMFYKKRGRSWNICVGRSVKRPPEWRGSYPDLFPCFGVELRILGHSWYNVEPHQLVSDFLLDVRVFADSILDVEARLLHHLENHWTLNFELKVAIIHSCCQSFHVKKRTRSLPHAQHSREELHPHSLCLLESPSQTWQGIPEQEEPEEEMQRQHVGGFIQQHQVNTCEAPS